jgi:hypothetical protein
MISLQDALLGARLLVRLAPFLREPIGLAEARAVLRGRLEQRERDFLALVRDAVYASPASPYRTLLALAGCEQGDLERLVSREGLEAGLRVLYGAGVYLTVAEFKGRRPVVRGSTEFQVEPGSLRNPIGTRHMTVWTGGSRGVRTPITFDLRFVQDAAVNRALTLASRGRARWRLAFWDVPGGTLTAMLAYAKGGIFAERWFSLMDPDDPGLDPRYRWSARLVRGAARAAGRTLPAPERVPVTSPLAIAAWMRDVLAAGDTPLLLAYSSLAVRLCRGAADAGIDLGGAQLVLYGEPVTEARLAAIRRCGAEAWPIYVTTETSRLADGCLEPAHADDVHLFHDCHALIQPGDGRVRPDLPAGALLVSTLRRTAPLILLNVSMGDEAVVEERRCGCALEGLGWRVHLRTIRSYEKLTAGGMTFLDGDIIPVLEEWLPARFGGGPTDYQLVEDSSAEGDARVRLLVHPSVGPLDPAVIAEAFLTRIGAGPGAARVMGLVWQDAQLLRVERRPPIMAESGKILHLHIEGRNRRRPGR